MTVKFEKSEILVGESTVYCTFENIIQYIPNVDFFNINKLQKQCNTIRTEKSKLKPNILKISVVINRQRPH